MAESRERTIGIDLGTTYLGIASAGKMIPILYGNELWPSLVQITKSAKWSLRGLEKTAPVDWRMDVEFSKLLIGRPQNDGSLEEDVASIPGAAMDAHGACYKIFNRTYRPEEISGFLLGKVYRDIVKPRGKMDKVVITIPAYFGEAQRHSTLVAAEIAGFDLSVIDLVPEPVAAAVHVTRSWEKVHEKIVVVVDIGGGTTDLTVIQIFQENRIRRFCVLAAVGNNRLGGKNLDDRLLELVCKRATDKTGKEPDEKVLRAHCESAKQFLSVHDEVNVPVPYDNAEPPEINISRKDFISACRWEMRQFDQLLKKLQLQEKTVYDAEHLILSGGSCNIPEIQALAKKACPKATVEEVVADKAVALGASWIASDPLLTIMSTLPKNIGIWCRNGQLQTIAKQPAHVPGTFTGKLFTHEETKDIVEFSVMEGDSTDAKRATEVAQFSIRDLGCPPPGTEITVIVDIQKLGVMDVQAKMTTEKGEEARCKVEFKSPFSKEKLLYWKERNSRRLIGEACGDHEDDNTDDQAGDVEAGDPEAGDPKAGDVEAGDVGAGGVEASDAEAGDVEAGVVVAGGIQAGGVEAGGVEAGGVDAGDVGHDGADDGSAGVELIETGGAETRDAENGDAETGDAETGGDSNQDDLAQGNPAKGGGAKLDAENGDAETGDAETGGDSNQGDLTQGNRTKGGGAKPLDGDDIRGDSHRGNKRPSTRGAKISARGRKRAKTNK